MADEEDVKPIIGAYANPEKEEGSIKDKRNTPATPAKNLIEGVEGELRKDIEEASSVNEKADNYEKKLEEAGITLDEAHEVIDDILTQGYYEESLPVTKNSSVTFRTRSYSDYIRYCRALEVHNPRYVDEQQEIMRRYFLAGSLVAFKGHVFPRPKNKSDNDDSTESHDSFSERLRWVESRPQVLIDLLINKLNSFDNKIRVIMSEGVVENF